MNQGYKSCEDKSWIKVVFRERKHRNTNVTEYKILSQEVQKLEQLFRPLARIRA